MLNPAMTSFKLCAFKYNLACPMMPESTDKKLIISNIFVCCERL